MHDAGRMLPHDPDFLQMTTEDYAALNVELTPEQVKQDLQSPTMRKMMAMVKRRAMLHQQTFFSSATLPATLHTASPREAYFTGLVVAGRAVLDLQREIEAEVATPPDKKKVLKITDTFREAGAQS